MKCSKCGSRDIDFQESIGQSICVNCGTVLEENTIVSSIEFQESGDRSHVVGQYISASCSKPYSGGRPMGGHGESRDPRDATLVNARRAITQVAGSLRLPPLYIDRAYRLYQLALQRNFIFGRKQLHVVATCLYIICRQEKSPHLLIDFSDALQINVYVLGKSFLQFSKVLNLNLPVVDPSLYIHRYATRLDLGESRASVVATSLRIITRLKKDWITTGRRPDGICALAMLVSARAHDFDVNQDVICKLFRVSPDLLRRRIEDFRSIPSAQLTLEQFHTIDAELEYDPPSYIRNVVRDAAAQAQKYEYGDGSSSSSGHAGSVRHVRLALPGVKPARATPSAVSRSSSGAASAAGHGRGYGERKSADGDGSDHEETAPGAEDDTDNVMRDPESLISDEVFQQLPGRANQKSSGGQSSSSSSRRGNGKGGGGQGEEEDSSDDEEIQMQPALGAGGVAALRRQQEQLYQQYARQEEMDAEDDDYRLERDADGAVVVRTKIADVDIAVPVPGQRKRRRMTDTYMLRIQQRKDLYEDVYQQVLQGCEGSASQEGVEALQREAQTIEDATHGVGGWGDQQSRIKERRVVLCVEKGAIPSAPGAGGASGSGTSSSSAGAVGTKLKFRKLNNGADASIPFGAAAVKTDTEPTAAKAATATAGTAAKDAVSGVADGPSTVAGEKGEGAAEGEEGAKEGEPAEEDADNLEDVLGGELGRYLLSEEEQQKRAIIWEKAFRPFMDERESRRKAKEQEQQSKGASDRYTQGGKLRRKYTRKAQAAGAAGAAGATTTSQAVLQAQQQAQARSSKKINYDALKGVFGQNGGFAPPNPSVPTRGAASASTATADLASSQAYLDSIMGIGIPGVTPVPGTAPAAAVSGSAAVVAASGFQKDVRRTALGSSIAKTTQRGAQKSAGGSLLTAGTALSTGAGRGSSKLGPAFAAASSSTLLRQPGAVGPSATSTAASTTATAAAGAGAQGYADDLGDGDDGEEDQLLYEGGGGDDGDYDDYDDEYY